MKRLILFICIVFFGLTVSSFKIPFNSKAESFKNIVLFYIENSKGTDNNSLSTLTLEKLKTEVKKNIYGSTTKFLFYWSNDTKYEIATKTESSIKIINQLNTKNSSTPNVWLDKYQIRNLLFEKEFVLKGTITINFFVTDNFIEEHVLKQEPSILMGMLPNELAFVTGIEENKVIVNVFYSNAYNRFSGESLVAINNFKNSSNVIYNYNEIK